jgi:hypothetical protein
MGRKTEVVLITAENRDKGKRFLLTEMPALKAERWATRALVAMAHSGVQIPQEALGAGIAGLAVAGFNAMQGVDYQELRVLLDEMMTCVQVMPDPQNASVVRPLIANESDGDDIEEITTYLHLRQRIFALHTDFFTKGEK